MALGAALGLACGGNGLPPAAPAPAEVPPVAAPAPPPPEPAPPEASDVREVALGYSASPECPEREAYLDHVRARATRLRLAPDMEPAPGAERVVVSVAPESPGTWLGQVSIEGDLALERQVRGERCEDVVAALALITVLRLEGAEASAAALQAVGGAAGESSTGGPEAGGGEGAPAGAPSQAPVEIEPGAIEAASPAATPTAPASDEEEEKEEEEDPSAGGTEGSTPAAPSEEQPAAPSEDQEENAPVDAESAPPALPEPAPARPPAARAAEPGAPGAPDESAESSAAAPAPVASRAGSVPLQTSLGVNVGYVSVPEHALRGELGAELRWGRSVASWATGLSLAFAGASERTAPADLGFALLTAELELCTPGLGSEGLWLRACGGVRAGALRLSVGPRVPGMERGSVVRPWLALDPSLQLGVRLAEHWTVRGFFELAAQLVRDRFNVLRVEDSRRGPFTVYRPPALSVEAGAGLSYAF